MIAVHNAHHTWVWKWKAIIKDSIIKIIHIVCPVGVGNICSISQIVAQPFPSTIFCSIIMYTCRTLNNDREPQSTAKSPSSSLFHCMCTSSALSVVEYFTLRQYCYLVSLITYLTCSSNHDCRISYHIQKSLCKLMSYCGKPFTYRYTETKDNYHRDKL